MRTFLLSLSIALTMATTVSGMSLSASIVSAPAATALMSSQRHSHGRPGGSPGHGKPNHKEYSRLIRKAGECRRKAARYHRQAQEKYIQAERYQRDADMYARRHQYGRSKSAMNKANSCRRKYDDLMRKYNEQERLAMKYELQAERLQ